MLPRPLAPRAHLVAPLPVLLGAAVALHQVLRRVRLVVGRVRVVEAPQLERVQVELRRELVEQALEPERPLDEAGRAERLHRRRVDLRRVEDRAHVLAVVEQPHRAVGRRGPAVPAGRVHELAGEREQRPVGLGGGGQPLNRGVAVPGREVLLAPGERAADRTAGALRELDRDERVVARAVLRAEAAAHELADDAHLVRREAELARDLVADAEDELRRDVDVERVAAPLAHRLMRLERAVEDGLCPVLGLDDDVRLGERAVDVAALVAAHLADELALVRGLFGVEQRLLDVPLDVDQPDRRPRLLDRVGGDRSDRLALVAGLVGQRVDVSGADCAPNSRSGERPLERDLLHACARVRGPENRGVQHPGQPQVGRVPGLAPCAHGPRHALCRTPDDLARPGRPLLERVFLDDEPDFLEAALDLFLGTDQPCHVEIASSIFGYVPQRHRFPAIACRISSELGLGLPSTSAEAETI